MFKQWLRLAGKSTLLDILAQRKGGTVTGKVRCCGPQPRYAAMHSARLQATLHHKTLGLTRASAALQPCHLVSFGASSF